MSRSVVRRSRFGATSKWLPEGLRNSVSRTVSVSGGSFVIALAIAVALAMLSYDAGDPSWNTASSSSAVSNWLGKPGSHIADILWQFLGAAGFLVAVILASWGWCVSAGRGLGMLPWRIIASMVAVISSGIGIAVLSSWLSLRWLDGMAGAFGEVLGNSSLRLMPLPKSWGAPILVFLASLVSTVSLYMACALQLGEWQKMVLIFHRVFVWLGALALSAFRSFMSFVRSERDRYMNEELWDDEDEENADVKAIGDQSAHKPKTALRNDAPPSPKPTNGASGGRTLIKASGKTGKKGYAAAPPQLPSPDLLSPPKDGEYSMPPLDFLQWPDDNKFSGSDVSEAALEKNARLLETVLADFGVYGQVKQVSPGPVVTLYELEPRPGTRASRVILLADDIARNMSATSARVSVVSGRNVIGIELPNRHRETVYLREILSSDRYVSCSAGLPLALGKDISGDPVIADLVQMPHLLIAGTTGSGKSVAINTMIMSLLYHLTPQKCRFIMIDPKMLELSVYDGIPHLLTPVVTDPKKAIVALKWAVREMDERYRAMSKLGVRGIEGYNNRLREAEKNGETLTRTVQTGFDPENGRPIYEEQNLDLTPLPYIVVIVDEMADLMIVAGKEIESAIQRLAQMARAAGIHLMMATQRPSVDVITGTIRSNFPTRISFHMTSKIDSRTILGEPGAEQLLGQGDMLYMSVGGRITRVHGPYIKDGEVEAIVKYLKKQGAPEYRSDVTTEEDEDGEDGSSGNSGDQSSGGNDLYDKAVDLVLRERKASTSFLQRHLQIGYNRAATLIERMEREGVIGCANHVGKREVLGRKPDE